VQNSPHRVARSSAGAVTVAAGDHTRICGRAFDVHVHRFLSLPPASAHAKEKEGAIVTISSPPESSPSEPYRLSGVSSAIPPPHAARAPVPPDTSDQLRGARVARASTKMTPEQKKLTSTAPSHSVGGS